MKPFNSLAAVAVMLCFGFAPIPAAADPLFPTAVLGAGRTDAELGAYYTQYNQPLRDVGSQVEFELTEAFETLALRAGLGGGFQMGVEVPYYSLSQFTMTVDGEAFEEDDSPGEFGNIDLALRWRLAGGTTGGFSLAMNGAWMTNSAGDPGDGYRAGLATGWRTRAGSGVHLDYEQTFYRGQDSEDSRSVTAGAFLKGGSAIFAPSVAYTWVTFGGETLEQYLGTLDLHLRIAKGTYFTPSAGYAVSPAVNIYGRGTGWSAGIGFYRLFGGRAPAAPAAQ